MNCSTPTFNSSRELQTENPRVGGSIDSLRELILPWPPKTRSVVRKTMGLTSLENALLVKDDARRYGRHVLIHPNTAYLRL